MDEYSIAGDCPFYFMCTKSIMEEIFFREKNIIALQVFALSFEKVIIHERKFYISSSFRKGGQRGDTKLLHLEIFIAIMLSRHSTIHMKECSKTSKSVF